MSRTAHRSGSVSVIVPTYQEAENIADLVGRIEAVRDEHNLELDLLILDDPSDDGTARIVADLAKPWVRLISRSGKRGLSYAVADGLAAATGDRLLVMDADLSHPPEAIPSMLAALDESTVDFVIGSRYVPGASTDEAWKFLRWVNSKIAAWLARPFTRAKDPMAGFFALRRQTYESAETLNPIGYKIGLELLVKCGCRNVAEVPIHFAARAKGQSKLNLAEQLRYLRHLKRLADYKYGTLSPGRGRVVKLLIALAVLNAVLVPVFAFKGTTELDVYLTAASHLARGEEIYRVAGDIGPAFTYPPLSALIVTPLVLLPVLGERIAWCVVQITLATVLLSALWCGLRPRLNKDSGARHGAAAIFWTVLLLVGLRYLLFPLDNQSQDLVVAALIAGGALLGARGRDGLGGLLLGLATALKATPLLFLPVLALQQRWRAVGAMLAAILIASAVPDLVAPRNDGESNIVRWIEIASSASDTGSRGGAVVWYPWNHLNQNLADTVYRLTAAPPSAVQGPDVSIVQLSNDRRGLLTMALQGLVLLTVLGVTLRSDRLADPASDTYVQRRLGEAGVVACGMILLSPMSSKAHYCVLLIGVAVVAVEFGRRPRAVLGGLLALMFVASTLTAKGILGSERGNLFLALGSTMLSAVLLLGALIPCLARRRGLLAYS